MHALMRVMRQCDFSEYQQTLLADVNPTFFFHFLQPRSPILFAFSHTREVFFLPFCHFDITNSKQLKVSQNNQQWIISV